MVMFHCYVSLPEGSFQSPEIFENRKMLEDELVFLEAETGAKDRS